MSLPPRDSETESEKPTGFQFWAGLAFVYAILVTFSLLRVPIPGVNEPHYLCKAKHFWDPGWCARDLFLSSSNPHLVFYVTFGWLTKFLSLDNVAVIGRVVGLLPLAIGWNLLAFRITNHRWAAGVALSIFLILQSAGNWSGEWLVGGIESKVIAYGFLFWSIGQAMDLKVPSSALLAGLSISYHPVVGVWGTISAVLASIVLLCCAQRSQLRSSFPSLRTWVFAVVVFGLAASPGVISAGQAVFDGDSETTRIANLLQVGNRLAHHLDPMKFRKEAYRYFGMLLLSWFVLLPALKNSPKVRWWNYIVLASLGIALIGVCIGWGPRPLKEMPGYEWRINALKFYPFRMADLLIPIAVSIALGHRVVCGLEVRVRPSFAKLPCLVALAVLLTWAGLRIPASDQNPGQMPAEKRQNWIEACRWIDENIAEESLVYSFDNQWAVKWYSQRSEFVNYKDCPQDAEAIVEWNKRLWLISNWKKKAFLDDRVSSEELRELAGKTKVEVFLCDRMGPVDSDPVYQNEDFRIYRVGETPNAELYD